MSPSHVHCCLPGSDDDRAIASLACVIISPTTITIPALTTDSISTITSTAHPTPTGILPRYALGFPASVPLAGLFPPPGPPSQTPPDFQGTVQGLGSHPRITHAKGSCPPVFPRAQVWFSTGWERMRLLKVSPVHRGSKALPSMSRDLYRGAAHTLILTPRPLTADSYPRALALGGSLTCPLLLGSHFGPLSPLACHPAPFLPRASEAAAGI